MHYEYHFKVGGKVAAIGARMLEGTARSLVGVFFQRLTGSPSGGIRGAVRGWFRRKS